MELYIRDKVAAVTGASEGIGKAIASGLAQEGAKIAISARRKRELDLATEEIRKETGADVLALTGDMSNRLDVEQFINAVTSRWGTIHILVNNVGRSFHIPFAQLSQEDMEAAVRTNIYSAVYCAQLALPFMQQQKWGRIINIASISGKEPNAGIIASNIAKSGAISFSKSLASEVAADGITVNCVCPGRILTAQTKRILTAEQREQMAQTLIPARRFGNPEELAALVVFLASERASYITGTTMLVDGGMARGIF